MSEKPPRRTAAADLDPWMPERRTGRARASGSLLQFASSPEPEVAHPVRKYPSGRLAGYVAPAFAPVKEPANRRIQQPENVAPYRPHSEPDSTVTLGKIGDFLELDFRRLFVWLRAGLLLACGLALVGAVLGGSYALLAKKRYTVETDIMINPGNLQIVDNDLYSQSGQIDSQLLSARTKQRVLTSRNVLSRVVDELHLTKDPEFYNPDGVSSLIGASSDPKLAALGRLQDRVSAEGDESSFVTALSVSAETPDKAIAISQAIVKTFQEELAKGEAEGASRAAAALDGRLEQMKGEVQAAEEKVVAYRRDNNLSTSNGQLVSSQAMTQLNIQIVNAQARAAAAQASYDTLVTGGIKGTNANANVSEALAELRNKANSLGQDIESQSIVLGPRHPTILKLKIALDAVNDQIKAEFAHNVEVAKASRDTAKIVLASLNARLNDLQGNVFSDGESEVALRELERDSAAKTAIYESFLSRARQITEQQQIDTTNVQVISTAVPPKGRSWPPRTVLMAALGAFGGFALGLLLATMIGIWRDTRRPPAHQTSVAA